MSRDDVFRAPKGVHDVLPPESGRWVEIVACFAERAARYGYGLAITPMFEHVEVFHRVGEHTDVVAKEMYELTDKGGRRLALRPEGTASVVRAYVEHRPTPPWKVWYVAPNFRYERAQKGRYRQHWQLGVEALGVDDPDIDVEVIALLSGFYRDIGLSDVRLLLNSMGDAESRAPFVAALRDHFLRHGDAFGEDFVARVEANPMRVLDAKVEAWQDVIGSAPQLPEFLSPDATAKFERVQAGLSDLGIDVELDPRLVRGFDYYTGTTFEFQSAALDAAQNAVGGGGRYDRLAEEFGGPPTPGIGFGSGIERIVLALDALGAPSAAAGIEVFVVDGLGPDGGTTVGGLVEALRADGFAVDRAFGGRSVKAQWKAADRSGAAVAVMVGRDELDRDAVAVKDLASGEQEEVSRTALVAWLTARRERVSGR
ncbi:MAG: histidine--tRNA ligase [Acidimicrobiia bacterium]|nr:histidine--tRNA ligase [Acidimicrobiia bacterium]